MLERNRESLARVSGRMSAPITVVSGLPRSGTSMMMQILEAGGIPPLADAVRGADEDNPRGYYEYEPVKRLEEDSSWLGRARGRSIKVISELLRSLPPGQSYRIVFMMRRVEEVLASQRRMLERRGTLREEEPDDAQMRAVLLRHLDEVVRHLETREDFRTLFVSYNQMFEKPREHVARLDEFLGGGLDRQAMVAAIDPTLYRHRRGRP
jgi:hypothetical protein